MRKMISAGIVILLICILRAGAQCELNPQLNLPEQFILNEGEQFTFDVNVTNNVSDVKFAAIKVNTSIGLEVDEETGIMEYTPDVDEIGKHTYFILASDPQGCFEIRKVDFLIMGRPEIHFYLPESRSIAINESDFIYFQVNASSIYDGVSYDWFEDSAHRSVNPWFRYFTGYDDAGLHVVQAVVTDSRGLNSTIEWRVLVQNVNRMPVQRFELPELTLTPEIIGGLADLDDYFSDPDGDELHYTVRFSLPGKPEVYETSKVFDINIEHGQVFAQAKLNVYYEELLHFTVSDQYGTSLYPEPVLLRLAKDLPTPMFNITQNCTTSCSPWSNCMITNIKVRRCEDSCGNGTYYESLNCDYGESCFDNVKNQDEVQVDCGGVCEACPTCDDGKKNQGEQGIDCGGPCPDCPNCFDGTKNNDEADIDCGGSCQRCGTGLFCNSDEDCESLHCKNICLAATCSDGIMNQEETGIDCGGPCTMCGTCDDGMQNQGEAGIDCGGPCGSCSTCDDGKKNQDELLPDIGGVCGYPIWFLGIALLLIAMLVLAFARSRKLLHALAKINPGMPEGAKESFTKAIKELAELKNNLTSDTEKAAKEQAEIVNRLYASLLGLEGEVSLVIVQEAKLSNRLLRGMLLHIYKQADKTAQDPPLFRIAMEDMLDKLIMELKEIRELL